MVCLPSLYGTASIGDGLCQLGIPPDKLEEETYMICKEILQLSPTALKTLKASFNADVESITGIQEMAGISLFQYYAGDESKKGSRAFLEKRPPDYSKWR